MARSDPLVLGYAQALLSVAEAEGALGAVEDELFRFSKIVDGDGALREALTDIALPVENKKAMLHDLLGTRANPQTLNLLDFVVEQGRARELSAIARGLAEIAAERRKRSIAEVRSAVPLTERQRHELETALSEATGLTVELKALIDPTIVGGVLVRVGDQVFDGTVRSRLRAARDRLGSM